MVPIHLSPSSNAEEKSAELFLKFAEEFNNNSNDNNDSQQSPSTTPPLSHDDIKLVERYILMTKSHKIDDEMQADNDAKLFMDFDLDVLAWPADRYDEYAKQIRQEYSFVEKEAYRSGRIHVLKQLSSGSSIYFSTQWGQEAGLVHSICGAYYDYYSNEFQTYCLV